MARKLSKSPEFFLKGKARKDLWRQTLRAIDTYFDGVERLPVKSRMDLHKVRRELSRYDFRKPIAPERALSDVVKSLTRYQTHFASPKYFGLYDPSTSPLGVAADALVAAFNPQLASGIQSAFPIELEKHLVQALGQKLGYQAQIFEGSFTSGGSEANHTAVLVALASRFPRFTSEGLSAVKTSPCLLVSREAHHSFLKSARMCGLGDQAVEEVEIDSSLRMDLKALEAAISRARAKGKEPFFVAATFGTTKAGAADPLAAIGAIARRENLWFHTDAAWGGAIALSDKYRSFIAGIEGADSITLDAHKWLAVPMGAGLFFTRHPGALLKTFHLKTGYIHNPDADPDPYQTGIQWSRRFIGLKLFLSLAAIGFDGYSTLLENCVALGQVFRKELLARGWKLLNSSELPVLCFTDGKDRGIEEDRRFVHHVTESVVASGKSWISPVELSVPGGGTRPAIRAAVISFKSQRKDLDILLKALEKARKDAEKELE